MVTALDLDAIRAYAKAHRWDDAPASTLAAYVDQLADALEVVADALDGWTHTFVPGPGEFAEFCDTYDDEGCSCGRRKDADVHHTSAVVLAALRPATTKEGLMPDQPDIRRVAVCRREMAERLASDPTRTIAAIRERHDDVLCFTYAPTPGDYRRDVAVLLVMLEEHHEAAPLAVPLPARHADPA